MNPKYPHKIASLNTGSGFNLPGDALGHLGSYNFFFFTWSGILNYIRGKNYSIRVPLTFANFTRLLRQVFAHNYF